MSEEEKSVEAQDLVISENELGLGILDTLQKNTSIHLALDLIGRYILSYLFNKNKDMLLPTLYDTWDFTAAKTEDGDDVESSDYIISTIPVAGAVGGRIYPLSILNQTSSLLFKAMVADIKESVAKCLTKKPVAGTVRLVMNVSDKGTLIIVLMYIHKDTL